MTLATKSRKVDIAKLDQVANILKCIAHPLRLRILELLEAEPEMTVSEMLALTGIEQSLLSHHLTKMKDKGVLKSVRDGKNIRYSLTDTHITRIFDCIERCSFLQ